MITEDLKLTHCSWKNMIQCCYSPSHNAWIYVGYYGIKVCDRWRGKDGFNNFLEDVGKKPNGTMLLRKDKSKDYTLDNVYWGTNHDARRNVSINRNFEIGGVTKCMIDWAKEYGIPKSTLHYRLSKGMNIKDALELGKGRSGKVLKC